jgi:hypothetical protein
MAVSPLPARFPNSICCDRASKGAQHRARTECFAPLPTLPPLLQFAGIDEIPMRAIRMRDKIARWAEASRRTSDEA